MIEQIIVKHQVADDIMLFMSFKNPSNIWIRYNSKDENLIININGETECINEKNTYSFEIITDSSFPIHAYFDNYNIKNLSELYSELSKLISKNHNDSI